MMSPPKVPRRFSNVEFMRFLSGMFVALTGAVGQAAPSTRVVRGRRGRTCSVGGGVAVANRRSEREIGTAVRTTPQSARRGAGRRRARRSDAAKPWPTGPPGSRGTCRPTGATRLTRPPAAGAARIRCLRRGSDRTPRWR